MVLPNHEIERIDADEKFFLYVPEDYTFGGDNVLIIKESATGDGGVVINNGRSQEEVPINGTLFAVKTNVGSKSVLSSSGSGYVDKDQDDRLAKLNENMQQLMSIKDNGEVINFISPFKHRISSNQYYIKSLRFTTLNDDSSIGFSMILSENRSANILENDVTLGVKNGYLQALQDAIEAVSTGAGAINVADTPVAFGDWTPEEYQWNLDKRDITTAAYWKLKWTILRVDIQTMSDNALASNLGPLIRGIGTLLTPFSAESWKKFLQANNAIPKPALYYYTQENA